MALGAGLLCGLSAATQGFAYQTCVAAGLLFPPGLGAPWLRLDLLAIYPPWAIVIWWRRWGTGAPKAFILPVVLGLVVLGFAVYGAWPRRSQKAGEAHWASRQELQEAECLPRLRLVWHGWKPNLRKIGLYGVILGIVGWQLLKYYGGLHVLIDAGTQTGKTASVVIPTLLDEDPGFAVSTIIHDPKGGIYPKTAGYRAQLGQVIRLAPLDADTDQWNPWENVRWDTDDVARDCDLITEYLINPNLEGNKDKTSQHFEGLLKRVFRGITVYGLSTGIATTGAAFNQLVNAPSPDPEQSSWDNLMTVMKNFDHPLVQMAAEVATRPGDRELGSLQTTIANALDIFSDPRVAHMTNASTFTMQDLREQDQPCTLYYSVPFSDQHRLLPLTRLLLGQCFDYCTSRLTGWRHRMRVVLEEYESLGYFPAVMRGLDTWGEYGMQLVLVTPSMKSLIASHGVHHNFLEGCRVQLAFGIQDEQTAESISKRIGTHMVSRRRISTSSGRRTVSTDEQKESLIDQTGVLKLRPKTVLVKAGPHATLAGQARWYERERWAQRATLPLPS